MDSDDEDNIDEDNDTKPLEQKIIDENRKEKLSLLTIAYYNVGCQYEYLGELGEWREAFKKAKKVLDKYFPSDHPLSQEVRYSLKNIEKKMKKSRETK